jgi:hypothetical protein
LRMESSTYSTQTRLLYEELNPRASMTFSYVSTSDRKTQETPVNFSLVLVAPVSYNFFLS